MSIDATGNPGDGGELAGLRRDYGDTPLREQGLAADPLDQFGQWFEEARGGGAVYEPNAATLATATPDGEPDARVVLLKGLDPGDAGDARGLVFFSNYESRKAEQLAVNPRATLVFYWDRLHRQVRVTGDVSKVARVETEAYFRSRPRGSQLGAWASAQSSVLPNRDALERRYAELEAEYAGREVPVPPHWGGYRLVPSRLEFWQGRTGRLHDRLRYRRDGEDWVVERLAP